MRELALFAGAGGGILGGLLLGWRTVCAVEIDSYARRVLLARQADGCLEPFPIWDDVTTFDGRQWHGSVDVVSGGFPCQDISCAGKGEGLDGKRSGLWSEMARVIGEVQPAFVWVENSPMLVVRGLERVLWDMAALGFDARWGVFSAGDVGARHLRERCWIMAYAKQNNRACSEGCGSENALVETQARLSRRKKPFQPRNEVRSFLWWSSEPRVDRVAYGMAHDMDRLECLGNGQVPAVVRLAWETLMQ